MIIKDFGSKKGLIDDGLELAKFLSVRLVDNFPYGPETLWGNAVVDVSDVVYLNNQ